MKAEILPIRSLSSRFLLNPSISASVPAFYLRLLYASGA